MDTDEVKMETKQLIISKLLVWLSDSEISSTVKSAQQKTKMMLDTEPEIHLSYLVGLKAFKKKVTVAQLINTVNSYPNLPFRIIGDGITRTRMKRSLLITRIVFIHSFDQRRIFIPKSVLPPSNRIPSMHKRAASLSPHVFLQSHPRRSSRGHIYDIFRQP
jgi:hypothetical protein